MRDKKQERLSGGAAGFTLPAVLVMVAALLILAVGLLLLTTIERSTARSFVDRQRAELVAMAGLEEVRGVMREEMANDEYLVIQAELDEEITSGMEKAPHLFVARRTESEDEAAYAYTPLFSAATEVEDDTELKYPELAGLAGDSEDEWIEFETRPWHDKVRVAWHEVLDDDGMLVGRYGFWVEDLQGKLDPRLAGNADGDSGEHVRAEWPFPAAGVNPEPESDDEPALNQVAVFSMDPDATESKQGDLGKTLVENEAMLVSPGSVLAAAGVQAPLTRDDDGNLTDDLAASLEKGLTTDLQPYLEQPLVPLVDGIDPSVAGQPKKNLNRLLKEDRSAAVEEMAEFIEEALPEFEGRKGGFPDDYLRTLAANALDYADEDSDATFKEGSYRGLDAYPLVSEFLMSFRWDKIYSEDGSKYVELEVSTFVELWNMTDQVVEGDARVTYETAYSFPLGANPSVSLDDMSLVDSDASSLLTQMDGSYWFPEMGVELQPDEYRVYRCGTVRYKIPAGSSSIWIPSPLTLQGEEFGVTGKGYKMRWNGVLVDQARGFVNRYDSSLTYSSTANNQKVRATVPSHSHKQPDDWRNNMGDPRMSFYNTSPQDANKYPDNYSPNRRNVRYGTIYRIDSSTKPKVYGRVMPSEWPDGGHNSEFESRSFYTTSESYEPDDPRFFPSASSILRNPVAEKAVMRISNRGYFLSVTELGRVYDPIMWRVDEPSMVNGPWGDVELSTVADSEYGGGNTLRIGRPEHPKFDEDRLPGMEAYRLLDLFHAGRSRSEDEAEREGNLVRVEGHVNLNTASREVLRALVYGAPVMDPELSKRLSDSHETSSLMAPRTRPFSLTDSQLGMWADELADAIIRTREERPFASPSEVAEAKNSSGEVMFGNLDEMPGVSKVHMSDSAREEDFARVYEASTVRSRNFRVWVVGQALARGPREREDPEVLAEVRKVFSVFADPGEREEDGSINPDETSIEILHENNF